MLTTCGARPSEGAAFADAQPAGGGAVLLGPHAGIDLGRQAGPAASAPEGSLQQLLMTHALVLRGQIDGATSSFRCNRRRTRTAWKGVTSSLADRLRSGCR
jgi:hypothetical protein